MLRICRELSNVYIHVYLSQFYVNCNSKLNGDKMTGWRSCDTNFKQDEYRWNPVGTVYNYTMRKKKKRFTVTVTILNTKIIGIQ